MRTLNEKSQVEYDEVNSFYLLVHVMKVLNYNKVFDKMQSGLREMTDIVEQVLQLGYKEISIHLRLKIGNE